MDLLEGCLKCGGSCGRCVGALGRVSISFF